MDANRDDFPQVRLSDAVLDDALGRLTLCPETHIPEVRCSCGANADSAAAYAERVKAQTRAAKEIQAAHADPDWLNEH